MWRPPAAIAGLSQQERNAAIATHRVVPLAGVIHRVRARYGGHIVRIRLCEQDERLVYVLTVLPRDGKVVRAAYFAESGAEAGGS